MGAKAAHEAQRPPLGCVPDANNRPGACVFSSLLVAYGMVLAFGIAANLQVQKLEAIMNVAAIAGLVVLWAAFWRASRRDATGHLRRDWRRHAVSTAGDQPMTTKKAGSLLTDHWGPASIIGSLSE